jgi:hypothetical protein
VVEGGLRFGGRSAGSTARSMRSTRRAPATPCYNTLQAYHRWLMLWFPIYTRVVQLVETTGESRNNGPHKSHPLNATHLSHFMK